MRNRSLNKKNLLTASGVIVFITGVIFVFVGVFTARMDYSIVGLALMSPLVITLLGLMIILSIRDAYNAIFPRIDNEE